MQKKLSQWAEEDKNRKIKDLYSLLCNQEWLREAHKHVNTNHGRNTAGIDGVIMHKFNENLDHNIKELSEQLKAKTFEPQPVKRVYIPKANGKLRPLGIPTICDRIVQETLRMILEPIWEADFSVRSYGFRPNRSTYDAISYISNRLTGITGQGYQWVIEGDIASYFDTIPHRRLIKAVKKRVADKNIRDILWQFLRAGVMYRDKKQETLSGTPQGGIVSPLLANIYLDELDKYMESNYLNFSEDQRKRRRKQGKENLLYVRYADDFVVLCNGTKAQTLVIKEELTKVLDNLGLVLSEEKTKVTHITEGIRFLGYWIERSVGETGKMVPKVLIPEDAIKRFRHKIREITAPNTCNDATNAKISALNSVTRGWCNYYRITTYPHREFNRLRPELYWGLAHWLGRKYKESMPVILQKYRKGQSLGTKTRTLVMPTEIKARKRLGRVMHNPYTGKENIEREEFFSYEKTWTGHDDRPERMDLREEVILLKGTMCYICRTELHPSEVEIDHSTKPRAAFKDKTEADRMKHLQPICTSCHRAKTKTDQMVLSRMR